MESDQAACEPPGSPGLLGPPCAMKTWLRRGRRHVTDEYNADISNWVEGTRSRPRQMSSEVGREAVIIIGGGAAKTIDASVARTTGVRKPIQVSEVWDTWRRYAAYRKPTIRDLSLETCPRQFQADAVVPAPWASTYARSNIGPEPAGTQCARGT